MEGTESVSLQVVLNHRKQLARLLGTAGIDPNAADADGDRRPLHWAAARGHNKCLELLLKHGADPKEFLLYLTYQLYARFLKP